jgi:hypothetical protein
MMATSTMDHDRLSIDTPELWDVEEEELLDEPPSPWRRRVILIVAVLAAFSLAAGPLYNLIDRGQPPTADNGLEICGFDYCIVQDSIRDAGLEPESGELANLILTDDEARDLGMELTEYLEVDPIELTVVERLGGRLGGVFDPNHRTIVIERPATAWVVSHEVAHAVAAGHGGEFTAALVDLVEYQTR